MTDDSKHLPRRQTANKPILKYRYVSESSDDLCICSVFCSTLYVWLPVQLVFSLLELILTSVHVSFIRDAMFYWKIRERNIFSKLGNCQRILTKCSLCSLSYTISLCYISKFQPDMTVPYLTEILDLHLQISTKLSFTWKLVVFLKFKLKCGVLLIS